MVSVGLEDTVHQDSLLDPRTALLVRDSAQDTQRTMVCPLLQSFFLPYELNSWELRKGTKATVFLLTEESDSRQTGNTAKSLSQYWGEGETVP